MSKHTAGPWNSYVNHRHSIVIRKMFDENYESHEIARCCSGFADARLIAAAPDLLEVLRNIVKLWDHHASAHHDGIIYPLHQAARAAIAKAEGRE